MSSFLPARIFSLTISLCINIKKIEITEWKFSTVLPKEEVLGGAKWGCILSSKITVSYLSLIRVFGSHLDGETPELIFLLLFFRQS